MAAFYRFLVAPGSPDELEALLLDARRRLEEADDHAGLAYVWSALGYGVANARGRVDDWATASEQAHRHSRLAGRSAPPPPDLGVALVVGIAAGGRGARDSSIACSRRRASPWLLLSRAWLLAMLDRSEEARQVAQEANARLREQSGTRWPDWCLAEISTLAGDHEDASKRLRIVCDWLEATGAVRVPRGYLGRLGRSLCMLGRFDEAEQVARARAIARREARRPDDAGLHLAPGAGPRPRAPRRTG